MQENTKRILEVATKAEKVAVITGAGMSRESGIPTFRGQDGLWKSFRAEELATPEAFRKDPALVWEWYDWRRQTVLKAQPHDGHRAVAEMESHFREFLLITQNVDGLHPRAGSEKMVEIHGSIHRARCSVCSHRFDLPAEPIRQIPLHCPACQQLARPDVVWFGESYDEDTLGRCIDFLSDVDLVWVIGTSGMVSIPVYLAAHAARNGAFLVDVNPEAAEFSSYCDVEIRGTAGGDFPEIWSSIQAEV